MLLSWFRKLLKSFEVSNMITQCFNNPTRSLFWWFFLKIIQYFLHFFLSLRTVNIIQLLKWIIYLIYFIHFMNMFFIRHIIFGCQKNIGKFLISCIHSFCCICIRRQYFKPKYTIVFLHGFFFYNPTVFTHAYISTCTCI